MRKRPQITPPIRTEKLPLFGTPKRPIVQPYPIDESFVHRRLAKFGLKTK